MADVNRGNRPLSPHVQIYRRQMTSVSSIFVRITGNALILGSLLLVWWFAAAATSPDAFARADGFITSWFGDLIMLGSLWCLYYHMLGGIRHLVWDMGYMLEVDASEQAGWMMFIGATLLTILTIIIV